MDGETETEDAGTRTDGAVANAALPTATKFRLGAEMLLLYLGLPATLIPFGHTLRLYLIPLLWLGAGACWLWLRSQPGFDHRKLWNGRRFAEHLVRTLLVFLPLGALATFLVYAYAPQAFLAFPRHARILWLIVLVGYPVLSAYPQEVIYRTFFYERYGRLFAEAPWLAVVVNVLLFGWAHIFLGNWIAPVFAGIGGLLFSRTYFRSGGILQSTIEHGLWGDLLFTLGLGWYFYAGSLR